VLAGYKDKELGAQCIVQFSMKTGSGSRYFGMDGSMGLFLAAAITASLALGLTFSGVWSFKSYNPAAPPEPVCPMGYHFVLGECVQVTQPTTCPDGYHLEGASCSPDVVPTCPEGFIYAEGQCAPIEQPPEPQPKPDPEPDPTPVVIPFSELHGVNYVDEVLTRKEGRAILPVQTETIERLVPIARDAGFNVFRIPVNWESYVGNEANFLGQLVALVETANANDIFVWVEFHQFEATSNWPVRVSDGRGFPEFVVSCYDTKSSYQLDREVRQFWHDYYTNNVRDSGNLCRQTLDVWTLHAEFMLAMIEEIDHYPNVIGYEILNEPHVWKDQDYENLGKMHTSIAKKLRTGTDKLLIFTRETGQGQDADGRKYVRNVELGYKILPQDPAKNVMYMPHLYNLNEIEENVKIWKDVKKQWKSMGYDVNIGVGEWAPQPPFLPEGSAVTQENVDRFVKVWEREKWMHTYWAYGGFRFGEGEVLVWRSGVLTEAGEYYEKSIDKFYEQSS